MAVGVGWRLGLRPPGQAALEAVGGEERVAVGCTQQQCTLVDLRG